MKKYIISDCISFCALVMILIYRNISRQNIIVIIVYNIYYIIIHRFYTLVSSVVLLIAIIYSTSVVDQNSFSQIMVFNIQCDEIL